MKILTLDMGNKKLSGAKILLYGTCFPQQWSKYLKRFSKGRYCLDVCMQEEHMDRVGFKIATLLHYQLVKEITVLTNDGSPHCLQLHLLVEQAKKITKSNVSIKHFVVEEGDLIEIDSEDVLIARHLSHINQLKKK